MGKTKKIKLRKWLHDSLHDKYLQGVGRSKHDIKNIHCATPYIHSLNTYKTYVAQCRRFCDWCYERDIRTPEQARESVQQYIEFLKSENKSAWTIYTAICAISKAYGTQTTEWGIVAPKRERANIKRSRYAVERDKGFSMSKEENIQLMQFGRATGLRRRELEALHGNDIVVNSHGIAFIHVKNGKGGKERYVEVYGTDAEIQTVLKRMEQAGSGKVFHHIHSKLDEHALRGQYACNLYRKYARDLERLETSEKYFCRKDKAGVVYDRAAMAIVSKNLGHNRISVVAENYLYNL